MGLRIQKHRTDIFKRVNDIESSEKKKTTEKLKQSAWVAIEHMDARLQWWKLSHDLNALTFHSGLIMIKNCPLEQCANQYLVSLRSEEESSSGWDQGRCSWALIALRGALLFREMLLPTPPTVTSRNQCRRAPFLSRTGARMGWLVPRQMLSGSWLLLTGGGSGECSPASWSGTGLIVAAHFDGTPSCSLLVNLLSPSSESEFVKKLSHKVRICGWPVVYSALYYRRGLNPRFFLGNQLDKVDPLNRYCPTRKL